jgi:hypothetical protein
VQRRDDVRVDAGRDGEVVEGGEHDETWRFDAAIGGHVEGRTAGGQGSARGHRRDRGFGTVIGSFFTRF